MHVSKKGGSGQHLPGAKTTIIEAGIFYYRREAAYR
jgi:hypothetical protein